MTFKYIILMNCAAGGRRHIYVCGRCTSQSYTTSSFSLFVCVAVLLNLILPQVSLFLFLWLYFSIRPQVSLFLFVSLYFSIYYTNSSFSLFVCVVVLLNLILPQVSLFLFVWLYFSILYYLKFLSFCLGRCTSQSYTTSSFSLFVCVAVLLNLILPQVFLFLFVSLYFSISYYLKFLFFRLCRCTSQSYTTSSFSLFICVAVLLNTTSSFSHLVCVAVLLNLILPQVSLFLFASLYFSILYYLKFLYFCLCRCTSQSYTTSSFSLFVCVVVLLNLILPQVSLF